MAGVVHWLSFGAVIKMQIALAGVLHYSRGVRMHSASAVWIVRAHSIQSHTTPPLRPPARPSSDGGPLHTPSGGRELTDLLIPLPRPMRDRSATPEGPLQD